MKQTDIHQYLIEKCKQGDKKSQFKLYKLYYKAMYNTSLRITGNIADAEDSMQEAFLSAFNNMNTYQAEVPFGSWLKRIVINKSLDINKYKKEFTTTFPDTTVPDDDSLEEITLTVQKVQHAVQLLPKGYRIIVSLFLLEGYDHEEISQILNITESTSRSQLARGKKKLLQIMKTN